MQTRFAIGFVSLVAWALTAIADDKPSVESSEAIQRIIEEAMPDLLHGSDRGMEIVNRAAHPKCDLATVSQTIQTLQQKIKDNSGTFGDPVGWNYVGERKLGNVIRQYVYVCRYSNLPVIWRFTTTWKDGRWGLLRVSLSNDSTQVFHESPTDRSEESEGYLRLSDEIADAVVHARVELLAVLKNSMSSTPDVEKFYQIAVQVAGILALHGGQCDCIRVEARNIAGVMGKCSYVAYGDNVNGVFMTLRLYRAADEWKLIGLSAVTLDRMEDLVAGAPLELTESQVAAVIVHNPVPKTVRSEAAKPR